MSPILVRPVREQLEHDRVIRLLQAKYRRKHEVAINVGLEQTTSVQVGTGHLFPDLVLFGQDKSRRLQGTIEVETGESVNSLEAMAQWVPFSRLKAPFVLYVPPPALDAARRLCAAHGADPAEIWTYHVNFDQVRFTLVHRSANAPVEATGRKRGTRAPKARAAGAKPAAKRARPRAAASAKPAPKRPAPKKPAPKKPAVKKSAAKKPVAGKAALKTAAARKTAAKKPVPKKPVPKKAAAKSRPARHR